MNKQEYMVRLKQALIDLPVNEREEIINDYCEHFRIGLEKGITEEQISLNLGSPESIATQFLDDFSKKQPIEKKSSNTKTFMIIGLVIINIIFISGPFFAIIGTLIGLFIASVVMVVGGAVTIIYVALSPFLSLAFSLPVSNLSAIFLSIVLIILGILFFIASIALTKLSFKGFKAYINYMKKIIID